MSATPLLADANVRSHTYYVARSSVRCPHCGLATRLLALAIPPGHETLHAGVLQDADAHAGDVCGESAGDVWQRADVNALLFYVEVLPGAVQSRLQQLSRFFHPGYDPGALNSYWANHCEHCGSLLGDHELHCEPEGVFLPTSEAAAKAIRLLRFREPFAAAAVGYTCEPEFFTAMFKG